MTDFSLPAGFSDSLQKADEYGILTEDAQRIHSRLELAIGGVASNEPYGDLGFAEETSKFLNNLKIALHKELCDPTTKSVKESYSSLLNAGLTVEGIKVVAAFISKVATAINPTFVVSTVILYAAIWLLKMGLNYWCNSPIQPAEV